MKIEELDYHLPASLIAQNGLADRAAARLLVLHKDSGALEHRHFHDICEYLQGGDCLVMNDSRVIPARFFIERPTGGRVEGLFLGLTDAGRWQVLLKSAGRVRLGEDLHFVSGDRHSPDNQEDPQDAKCLRLVEKQRDGIWIVEPIFAESHLAILDHFGVTPLPPYIHRSDPGESESQDRSRYQTVYARVAGSVAAPTAGLHFTQEILAQLGAVGVNTAHLTLHIGLGTFRPITAETLEKHQMHAEEYSLDAAGVEVINRAIEQKARVVAVGTTSVRTLETLTQKGRVRPGAGSTRLFITPGYRFEVVDAMLTNFHLPRSTLLALVCAFAGTDQVLHAYRQAVELQYRFYSYGDAMLIL